MNNLQKEYINKNISVWFFVEDVGPFGTQIESKTGVHTVLPFEIKEIYETIVESSKLDGIIYGTFDISRNSNKMIIASKESISKINNEKNIIDINKPLICADPQIFASELLINK